MVSVEVETSFNLLPETRFASQIPIADNGFRPTYRYLYHVVTFTQCSLAENMLRGNDGAEAESLLITLRNNVRYETTETSSAVKEFAEKLSNVYNATCRMDNGSVMHIVSGDKKYFL